MLYDLWICVVFVKADNLINSDPSAVQMSKMPHTNNGVLRNL